MFTVTRCSALFVLGFAAPAMAMDSNFHIGFPIGTNQITSDDVRMMQRPPTEVEVPGGFRSGLRLGVNIKGYVGIEFNVDAQGWDLFKDERGGLGFVGGGLRLHPVQIAQHWKPVLKDREWDLSLAYSTGWHLLGQQAPLVPRLQHSLLLQPKPKPAAAQPPAQWAFSGGWCSPHGPARNDDNGDAN